MPAKLFGFATAALFALAPAISWGQAYGSNYVPSHGHGHHHGHGYGQAYGFGNYHHASTFEEGVLNGYANLLQGQGLYERYHSEALIGFQQARTLALQNDATAFKARLEASAIRKQLAADELAKLAERNRLAALRRTPSPTPRLVRQDGQLIWPPELQGEEFADLRAAVEGHFAALATGNTESAVAIKQELDRLVEFTGAKVRGQEMSATQLTAAIGFRDKAQKLARQWVSSVNEAPTVVSASY